MVRETNIGPSSLVPKTIRCNTTSPLKRAAPAGLMAQAQQNNCPYHTSGHIISSRYPHLEIRKCWKRVLPKSQNGFITANPTLNFLEPTLLISTLHSTSIKIYWDSPQKTAQNMQARTIAKLARPEICDGSQPELLEVSVVQVLPETGDSWSTFLLSTPHLTVARSEFTPCTYQISLTSIADEALSHTNEAPASRRYGSSFSNWNGN